MATKTKTPVRIYKDVDMAFTNNPITKDVGRKVDVQAVKQAMRNLFMYNRGEKKFDPNFGGGVRDLLFEPIDYITAGVIEKEIEVMINNYEPRVIVNSVQVQADPDNNSYQMRIDFLVKATREPQVYTSILERLR